MSSHGLQSCLEPTRLVEPRVLRLKLAPPKSSVGEYTFFLFSNQSNSSENNKTVYTPPTMKRSSSMLSDHSLEMCTENLGSETGSNETISPSELLYHENEERFIRSPDKKRSVVRIQNFPPPLTSINGVQVRSRREGGRLILEAVDTSLHPYFHAERANGRLRLHLMKPKDEDTEVEEVESEGIEENNGNVRGEMGNTRRPSRCKEGSSNANGGQDLLHLEPFLVAT